MVSLASSTLHNKVNDEVERSIEAGQCYEDDCHDYYDSIRQGCSA